MQPTNRPVNAVELRDVTKTFGKVVANDHVSLDIRKGEILSLLGENGSGKTTLMNMLAGIYFPDSGQILVDGKEVSIRSPKDSFALHIGMIHQHFKLVDVFSAAENIVLGLKDKGKFDRKAISQQIRDISSKYGFDLDPDKKIYDMAVSEKQTVEIIKVLYRGADILILDEPTAVLTPQETEKLFSVLRNMRADGKSIVIITHKLNEVMAISDRVSVLRKGQFIATVNTSQTSRPAADRHDGRPRRHPEHRPPRTKGPAGPPGGQGADLSRRPGRKSPGRRELRRQERGNSRHCRHRRQRPAGAAARPLRACIPSPTARSFTTTATTSKRRISWASPPWPFATWASPWPSCRRTGWAWASSAPWA